MSISPGSFSAPGRQVFDSAGYVNGISLIVDVGMNLMLGEDNGFLEF
jgi:hypothetical protein